MQCVLAGKLSLPPLPLHVPDVQPGEMPVEGLAGNAGKSFSTCIWAGGKVKSKAHCANGRYMIWEHYRANM
jgi:hypothetical protein